MRILPMIVAVVLMLLGSMGVLGALKTLVDLGRRQSKEVGLSEALALERSWRRAVSSLSDSFVILAGALILWALFSVQS